MMANERVNEDEAEAILSNLKMEGRSLGEMDRNGGFLGGEISGLTPVWSVHGLTIGEIFERTTSPARQCDKLD